MQSFLIGSFGWIGILAALCISVGLPMVSDEPGAIIDDGPNAKKMIELEVAISEIMSDEQPYELEFYIDDSFGVDEFVLYCDGKGEVATLYDNGDYDKNKDKVHGDGIFTGTVLIDGYTEDTELKFYAEAKGENNYRGTKIVDFSIIAHFTDEELNAMETVDNEIQRLFKEANAKIPEGATREEKIKIRYETIYPYLEELADVNNPKRLIENLYYSDEMISYDYIFGGGAGVMLYTPWIDDDLDIKMN